MVSSVKGLSSCIAEKEKVNENANANKSLCLKMEFPNPIVIPEIGNTYNILILNEI